uniref:Uncharacterized protein n=1 Tax=Rhipicephalus microplus TaxID=6941 RepID=A0A6G5AHS5_RHIMP
MEEAGVERVVTCVHFLSSSERVIKMHMFHKNKQKQVNKQTHNVNKQIASAAASTTTSSTTRNLMHTHTEPIELKPLARKNKSSNLARK